MCLNWVGQSLSDIAILNNNVIMFPIFSWKCMNDRHIQTFCANFLTSLFLGILHQMFLSFYRRQNFLTYFVATIISNVIKYVRKFCLFKKTYICWGKTPKEEFEWMKIWIRLNNLKLIYNTFVLNSLSQMVEVASSSTLGSLKRIFFFQFKH